MMKMIKKLVKGVVIVTGGFIGISIAITIFAVIWEMNHPTNWDEKETVSNKITVEAAEPTTEVVAEEVVPTKEAQEIISEEVKSEEPTVTPTEAVKEEQPTEEPHEYFPEGDFYCGGVPAVDYMDCGSFEVDLEKTYFKEVGNTIYYINFKYDKSCDVFKAYCFSATNQYYDNGNTFVIENFVMNRNEYDFISTDKESTLYINDNGSVTLYSTIKAGFDGDYYPIKSALANNVEYTKLRTSADIFDFFRDKNNIGVPFEMEVEYYMYDNNYYAASAYDNSKNIVFHIYCNNNQTTLFMGDKIKVKGYCNSFDDGNFGYEIYADSIELAR